MKAKIIMTRDVDETKGLIYIREIKGYDELYKVLGDYISLKVLDQIVKCDPLLGAVRYASNDIVRPLAVLILDENEKKVLSRLEKEQDFADKVYVNLGEDHIRLKLPIYVTSSQEIFNNPYILRLLAILGDLRKRIFSMKIIGNNERFNYIWELMAFSEEKEITRFLNSIPPELKEIFREVIWKNVCYPTSDQLKRKKKILLNIFFIYELVEEYDDVAIVLLEDKILDITYRFTELSRQKRLFDLFMGKTISMIKGVHFATDILKTSLSIAKFYVNHANNILHELEFLLSRMNMLNPVFDNLWDAITKEHILILNELSLIERSVTYFEELVTSIENTIERAFDLAKNDLLTFIELFLFLITVIKLIISSTSLVK